eukprot:GHVN01055622.1.p1 GENE.GHVN01055622.1~~GHVN01055622.1.p1  ORF type:complete len:252 (+),score=22.01 GHVN01055622.1:24-779(+)
MPPMMYRAAILGATGTVGQRFVELLSQHPHFDITALCASERSCGKLYSEACKWKLSADIPSKCAEMKVRSCDVKELCTLCEVVFSGLDSSVAGSIESECASNGLAVFSNAKNHRMDPDVPILLPTVNPDHLQLVKSQDSMKKSGGFIVTNANCASTAMCLALMPLHTAFGIEKIFCATLQATSGAGYPGISSMDILDNCIPYISDEEPKIESEPKKIMGQLKSDKIEEASMEISSMVHRVPVTDGHLISVP